MYPALGTRVVIGLAIAAALGLADVVGAFAPSPDVGEGTPWFITLITTVAGVVTLAGAALAVRAASRERAKPSGRVALWMVVGARAASLLASAPTVFLTGFTVPLAVWSVLMVVVTVVVIVLLVPSALTEDAPAR